MHRCVPCAVILWQLAMDSDDTLDRETLRGSKPVWLHSIPLRTHCPHLTPDLRSWLQIQQITEKMIEDGLAFADPSTQERDRLPIGSR